MLASRHFLIVPALVCFLAAVVSAQEVREWTDKNGKTLSGKFVELTSENNVKIDADGQTYTIPLSAFSQADQDYAKLQQANASKPAESKPKEMEKPKPTVKGSIDDNRQWEDFRGTEVKAKFVRMHDGYVILLQGANAHKISYYTLSTEDQKWLRAQLERRGEGGKILSRQEMELEDPDVHKELDEYISTHSSIPGYVPPGEEMNGGGSSRPPAYVPPENKPYSPPANTPYKPPSDEPGPGSNNGNPGDLAMNNAPSQPGNEGVAPYSPTDEGTPAPSAEDGETANTSAGGPAFSNRFRSSGGGGEASSVPAGYCPNCRQQLPAGIGPGDHCPRCNVYLEDWVTEGTGPPVNPWYKGPMVIYIVGGAFVAIAGLSLLSKKVYG